MAVTINKKGVTPVIKTRIQVQTDFPVKRNRVTHTHTRTPLEQALGGVVSDSHTRVSAREGSFGWGTTITVDNPTQEVALGGFLCPQVL